MSMQYFHARVGQVWFFHNKRLETSYVELVFLHPVGSAGHVVHSSASRAQNIDALFFKLGSDRYGFRKKCVPTRYAILVFLHSVRSVGHVVHSSAFGL
jgi:hypothetical protein